MIVVAVTATAVVASAAGLALGRTRAAAVPVPADLRAEAQLLALWQHDPDLHGRLQRHGGINTSWFAHPEHRRYATTLRDGRTVTAPPPSVQDALPQALTQRPNLVAALEQADTTGELDDALGAVPAAAQVRNAWWGRDVVAGACDTTVRNVDGTAAWPLQRAAGPIDPAALMFAAVAAVAAAVAASVVGTASVAAATWVLLWALFAVAAAVTDWSTMWVDGPTVAGWGVASAAAIAAVATETAVWVWPAALVAVGTVVPFELGGWWYRRFRGVEAHGGGDTLAIPLMLAPWLAITQLQQPLVLAPRWVFLPLVQHVAISLTIAAALLLLLRSLYQRATTASEPQVPFLPVWVAAAPAGAAAAAALPS